MARTGKRVLVYVGKDLADWLEGKAMEGYKKAGFIRHVLGEQMKREVDANGTTGIR